MVRQTPTQESSLIKMVKKRQPDLDFASTKNLLKGRNSVTLRDNKVSKNKQRGPCSDAVWAEAAKDLLFGGKVLRDLRSAAKTKSESGKAGQSSTKISILETAKKEHTMSTRIDVRTSQVSKPGKVQQPNKTKLTGKAKPNRRNKNPATSFLPIILASQSDDLSNESTPSRGSKDKTVSIGNKASKLKTRAPNTRKKPKKVASQTTISSTCAPSYSDTSRDVAQPQLNKDYHQAGDSQKQPDHSAMDSDFEIQRVATHQQSVRDSLVSQRYTDNGDQYQHVCAGAADDDGWIMAFTHRVELRGLCSVTLLKGSVTIHGYDMTTGETVNAYSPSGYFNTVIENETTSSSSHDICSDDIESWPTKYKQILTAASRSSLQSFLTAQSNVALIHCKSIRPAHLRASLSLLPEDKEPDIIGFIPLSASLRVSKCQLERRYSDGVLSAVSDLLLHQQTTGCLKLVVCGSKDMGKSTFLRHVANRLLSVVDKVAILDCDPGQTEFTPPGTLSLHSVSQPLLGPPWCRVPTSVDRAEYYGDISADADPDKYMSCMRRLVAEYRANSQYRRIPLLVNTMGWRQGLGLEFLSGTIVEVLPSHLMQLGVGESSYRNFPLFSKLKVLSHSLFLPNDTLAGLPSRLTYEVIPLLMEHVPNLIYSRDLLKAHLLRELMMTSYFTRNSTVQHVHCLTPYKVKFSSLAIHLANHSIPACHLPAAINGQVVALCTVNQQQCESPRDEGQVSLAPIPLLPSPLEFHGYGLVRAVDLNNKLLYISTPVSPASVSTCNLLSPVTGAITPNQAFLQQIGQVQDDQRLPYLGDRKVGAGTSAVGDTVQSFKRKRNQTQTSHKTTL